MKVYSAYAYEPGENEKAKANREAYEQLKHLCKFGDKPDGTHTIIEHAGVTYGSSRYRIIDNAAGLTNAEIAVFCDGGNLCFGYSAALDFIDVFTD